MSTRSVSKLRRAFALIASASVFAVAGFAQQTATPATAETPVKLEKYVVTGSIIPRTETAGEAQIFPVVVYNQDQLSKLGYKNTAELLQKISFSNGGSVPISNNATGTSGPSGASSISLRGLGPEATLVLVNGRRGAQYPAGGGGSTLTQAFVDLNTIPVAAIERVEILKDGASSSYGADAVAGVVNIILRKNYSGSEIFASYGNTTEKDSSETTISLIQGVSNDSGSLTVGATYYNRRAIYNADRIYTFVPPFVSTNATPANLQISLAAAQAALGLAPNVLPPGVKQVDGVNPTTIFATSGLYPGGANKTDPNGNSVSDSTNKGNATAAQYIYSNNKKSFFNFNQFSGSLPASERKGIFLNGERNLDKAGNVKLYVDGFYNSVEVVNVLAPLATGTFTGGTLEIVIPSRTAVGVLPLADGRTRAAPAGAYNPFNPFNMDITGGTKARLAEFGNRILRDTTDNLTITAGLKIDKIADKWSLDVGYRYNVITNHTDYKLIHSAKFNQILNANDPIFDPSSSVYVGTTSPYNPFGYFMNPIPNNAKLVDFATIHQQNSYTGAMGLFSAVLSTDNLFTTAAGNAGFALGGEYRAETLSQILDAPTAGGEVLGNNVVTPVNGQRKVAAVFAEIALPIFSAKQNISGIHDLTTDISVRHENFMSRGESVTVPKIGLKWQPSDNTLVVRGSASKGFREPSVFELNAPTISNNSSIFDPIRKENLPETNSNVKGNRLLTSEKTKSYNIGVVWSPKDALAGFTFSTDLWRIERAGTVTTSFQDTVNRSAGTTPGGLVPGESVIRDVGTNAIVIVNSVFRNSGLTIAQGVDFAASYVLPTKEFGRFNFEFAGSYLSSFKKASTVGGALTELVGTDASAELAGYDGYVKWKNRGEVQWKLKGFSALVAANFTGGFSDFDGDGNPYYVKSTLMWDAQLSYTVALHSGHSMVDWMDGTNLTLGCNNVLDKAPPLSPNGNNSVGYPAYLYNSTGRFVYLSMKKKF